MKKILLTGLFAFTFSFAFSQSYEAWVTKQVNFREEPSTDASIIMSLKPGTEIFVISLETENGFYNAIDIETNEEGYVHSSYVRIGKEVKKNDEGVFVPIGSSTTYNPTTEIFNNTDITLKLKLNDQQFSFSPHEKRTITLTPGYYDYRASAPGVLPAIGTDNFKSNEDYTWEFYIETSFK